MVSHLFGFVVGLVIGLLYPKIKAEIVSIYAEVKSEVVAEEAKIKTVLK